MISLTPIAYFCSAFQDKADLPRQAALSQDQIGVIRFLSGKQYEQALEDLEGMERLWILFWMHKVCSWKPKIQPPRDVTKKGVFSTRSPHRPNPIGMSCVKLLRRKGLDLFIQDHDLLDGTPILDIKPYLPYADSFPSARTGWIEKMPVLPSYEIHLENLALRQFNYLKARGVDIRLNVEMRLKHFISPSSYNRIYELKKDTYLQSYKTWRILFIRNDKHLIILQISSGYDADTLASDKTSPWNDLSLHREFCKEFNLSDPRNFNG